MCFDIPAVRIREERLALRKEGRRKEGWHCGMVLVDPDGERFVAQAGVGQNLVAKWSNEMIVGKTFKIFSQLTSL